MLLINLGIESVLYVLTVLIFLSFENIFTWKINIQYLLIKLFSIIKCSLAPKTEVFKKNQRYQVPKF